MPQKLTDIRVIGTELFFLPAELRMPLKFGAETLTDVVCARVRVEVRDRAGRTACGWGETPLSAPWAWPSRLTNAARQDAMNDYCRMLAEAWAGLDACGHPIEIGVEFQQRVANDLTAKLNARRGGDEPMPYLAALVCCSAFDIAVHDAFGVLHGLDVYDTYDARFMNRDLGAYLEAAPGSPGNVVRFENLYPKDFLVREPVTRLAAWHLVGGKDPIDASDLAGDEPDDGHPVLLGDWINTDGLKCLKVKLRGNDAAWDHERMVRVGRLAIAKGVDWLSADFNCTVLAPQYVNDSLDRLREEVPRIFGMLLYVEQPFPYDLESNRIDVHSVSARKPLFMDESAHDWRLVRLGRSLGWSGVALKTCKTQTGAILSLCWAKAHGMALMVQDLTNPMLAQVPHVRLAAHAGTIMGVETNGMQFYPDVSEPEAQAHPGLYRRRGGTVDLSTLSGPGFGYGLDRIERTLPEAACRFGENE